MSCCRSICEYGDHTTTYCDLLVKKYTKTITRHTIWTWEFIYWMTKSFNSIFQMFCSQWNDSLLASTFLFIVCFYFIINSYFISSSLLPISPIHLSSSSSSFSTLLIAIVFCLFCFLKKKESHNLFLFFQFSSSLTSYFPV